MSTKLVLAIAAIALASLGACAASTAPAPARAFEGSSPAEIAQRSTVHEATPATLGRQIIQVEGFDLARTNDGGWISWRLVAAPAGPKVADLAYRPNDIEARRAGWSLPAQACAAPKTPPALEDCHFTSAERGQKLAVYGCANGETLLAALGDDGSARRLMKLKGAYQGAFLSRVPHVGAWQVTLAGIDPQGRFHFAQLQWDDAGAIR